MLSNHLCEVHVDSLSAGKYEYNPISRELVAQTLDVISTIAVRPHYYSYLNHSEVTTAGGTYSSIKSLIEGSAASLLSYMRSNSNYFLSSTATPEVTVSSYSVNIIHSAIPTSTPTSQPSCGDGSEGTNVNCVPCNPGFYLSDFNQLNCEPCPLDYYTNVYGSETCTQCPSPRAAYQVGSTECTAYYLNYRFQNITANIPYTC